MKYSRCVVNGVFDLFHIGHVNLLKRAKEIFDEVIAAVDSDEFASRVKRQPVFSEMDRLNIVKSCSYVDDAVLVDDSYGPFAFEDDKVDNFMDQYNLDAVFIAADTEEDVLKWFSHLHKTNRTVVVPRTQDISTTHVIKIVNGEITRDRVKKNDKELSDFG